MKKREEAINEAKTLFLKSFKDSSLDEAVICVAPGRVNLIGEHTDYNDGFVLPLAIEKCTAIVARKSKNSTNRCRIISAQQQNQVYEFKADSTLKPGETNWTKFVQGVVAQYLSPELKEISFDAALYSNVPIGGGLSSSASLEVAIATMLEEMYNFNIPGMEKVVRCVQSDHQFAKVPCGIMDQAASSLCKSGSLLLIDCKSRETEDVPFLSPDKYTIVVCNSNSPHQHTDGGYKARVDACEQGTRCLRSFLKDPSISSLRDVSLEQYKSVEHLFLSEVLKKRVRHVLSENTRVLQTVELLKDIAVTETEKKIKQLGEYLYESHTSLAKLYEVSTEELDFLVETAKSCYGVVGSRMTGGGFGGCTITVVTVEHSRTLQNKLRSEFRKRFAKECSVFETQLCSGSSVVSS